MTSTKVFAACARPRVNPTVRSRNPISDHRAEDPAKGQRAQTEGKRALLADDTSMDFLTNTEMSQALRVAEFAQDEAEVAAIFQDKDRLKEIMTRGTEGSLRHLNVIGMDACLMAMIEVQYQVRKFADVMVGSQEVEPLRGWPYTEILQELNLRPTSDSAELAALIVDKYAESYVSTSRKIPNITQSAIDLSKMGEAALLIKDFSQALAKDFFDDLYLKDTTATPKRSPPIGTMPLTTRNTSI